MYVVEVTDLKRKSRFFVDEETGEVMGNAKLKPRQLKAFDAEPAWGKAHWVHMDMVADSFTGKAELYFRLMVYVKREGEILLSKDVREELMRKCGIGARTLENYLYVMNREGLIYRKPGLNGVYYLNPFAYTFGHWENSKKVQNQFRLNRVCVGDDLEAGRQDSPGGYSDSGVGSPGDECLLENPVQTKGG